MKNIVVISQNKYFNVRQILESGQVFRFKSINDNSFSLVARQKVIKLTQHEEDSEIIIENTTRGELESIWADYFDLNTDYHAITDELSQKDEEMARAISFGRGIRILKQEPWEMLISFIISQNKAIPHIKQCIENICRQYGTPIGDCLNTGEKYYAFPTPKQLSQVNEEALRGCKVGFRAPYIMDACKKVYNEEVNLSDLHVMSTAKAKEELMKIKGVGPKIADCILLFAYGKVDVFPTDVWIKRIVEGLYFEQEEVTLKRIEQFAQEYFGELAGYAQQYLFFYARENALFKNK